MLRVQAPDHRFYYSMAELLLHIFCLKGMSLHRAVEIIALNVFDLHTLQYSELLRGLDTFHADADADGLRQLRHHFDKGLGVGILRQIFDKALIHLDDINGNLPDMIQGGLAGTEIIQRQRNTQRFDPVQDLLHALHIVDGEALCHFQGQILRGQTGVRKRLFHRLHDVRL